MEFGTQELSLESILLRLTKSSSLLSLSNRSIEIFLETVSFFLTGDDIELSESLNTMIDGCLTILETFFAKILGEMRCGSISGEILLDDGFFKVNPFFILKYKKFLLIYKLLDNWIVWNLPIWFW